MPGDLAKRFSEQAARTNRRAMGMSLACAVAVEGAFLVCPRE